VATIQVFVGKFGRSEKEETILESHFEESWNYASFGSENVLSASISKKKKLYIMKKNLVNASGSPKRSSHQIMSWDGFYIDSIWVR